MKTVTLFLFLTALSYDAGAQTPPRFTVERLIQFAPGTDPVRKLLSADPSLRELVTGKFSIAREDLNDDGSKEMIIISEETTSCGSGGCSFAVLELRGAKDRDDLKRECGWHSRRHP